MLLIQVKSAALQNIFTPATEIVDDLLTNFEVHGTTAETLPVPSNIARSANHHRRKHKPKEPEDENFVVNHSHIPSNFQVKDDRKDGISF